MADLDEYLVTLGEEELNEELKSLQDEYEDNENDLESFSDDIEEGNYDGDSIEAAVYRGELEWKIDAILKVLDYKGFDVPFGYEHRLEELNEY